MTTRQDHETHRGDTLVLKVTVLDEDGLPVDLTSATGQFVVARDRSSAAALLKTSSGISFTDPTAGRVDVTLTAAETAALDGLYYYEFTITFGDSTISTVLYGAISFIPDWVAP